MLTQCASMGTLETGTHFVGGYVSVQATQSPGMELPTVLATGTRCWRGASDLMVCSAIHDSAPLSEPLSSGTH